MAINQNWLETPTRYWLRMLDETNQSCSVDFTETHNSSPGLTPQWRSRIVGRELSGETQGDFCPRVWVSSVGALRMPGDDHRDTEISFSCTIQIRQQVQPKRRSSLWRQFSSLCCSKGFLHAFVITDTPTDRNPTNFNHLRLKCSSGWNSSCFSLLKSCLLCKLIL